MEQWCRRVLLLQEASLGPQHPAVADTLGRLARALAAQGKDEEAEALYRRRLSVLDHANGPESPEVVDALVDLALHLQGEHRPAEEEALWKRAVAIGEQLQGPEGPKLVLLLQGLADCYATQSRHAEAAAALRRALAIAEGPGSPMALHVDNLIERLGEVALAQGDAVAAEPLLRRALESVVAAADEDEPDLAGKPWVAHSRVMLQQGLDEHQLDLLVTLALVLRALRRETEAAELDARASVVRARVARRGQILTEIDAIATGEAPAGDTPEEATGS
jgi:tetratricopeptide (TPR) repeat protein